jgi:hypothetical protein
MKKEEASKQTRERKKCRTRERNEDRLSRLKCNLNVEGRNGEK